MDYYIGIDIGGTNVRVVFATQTKFLLKLTSQTIKTGPPTSLANEIIQLITQGLKILEIKKSDIKGIGTSSAGPFVDGTKIFCPNISGPKNGNNWGPVPYIEPLRKAFSNKIPIELANDCVSSVQAEYLFGAGQGYHHLVYITISTGVGAGIICDDHLCQGKGHNAGHFGHMMIVQDGPKCGCGQHGCVESLVSGRSIAKRAKELGLKAQDGQEITSKQVFELYRKNNSIAQQLITETIEYIGRFFINVINITDCESLILGGPVIYYNFDILYEPICNYIQENSYTAISRGVELKLAGLGEFVGDVAGLSLVIPKNWIEQWKKTEPWKKGYKKEIDVDKNDLQ